jgi:hypothetical protein
MVQDLKSLADCINSAHAAGEEASRQALEHYRSCGAALLQAKKLCGHGNWLAWLQKNVRFGEKRVQRLMRLAKLPVTGNLEEQWRILDDARR